MALRDYTDDDVRQIVQRVVDHVRPERVVLFGSRARGDARPDSDVDLMVVMPDGVRRLDVTQDLYGLGIPRVDYVVATPSLLEHVAGSKGLVYRDVEREGRDLYVA